MSLFFQFVLVCLLLIPTKVIAGVIWKLDSKKVLIGQPAILTCTVSGVKTIDLDKTRQWVIGNHGDIVSYNGLINDRAKYEEILSLTNTFSLQINNVTIEDLWMTYECRYGFEFYRNTLNLDEIDIISPPTNGTTDISIHMTESVVTINLYFDKIYPIPNCSVEHFHFFNVIMSVKKEGLIKAYLSVDIPCKHEISDCDMKYNINCHLGNFTYPVHVPEYFVIYKDNFRSTLILGGAVIACVVVTITAFFVKKRQKKKNRDVKRRRENIEEKGKNSCTVKSKETQMATYSFPNATKYLTIKDQV